MVLYGKHCGPDCQTDHFADAFVCKNDARGYEFVKTFESLQLTPFNLLRLIQCKKMKIYVLAAFSVQFWLESGKTCMNFIIYVCSIALTLAKSACLMFKQVSQDLTSVNA